MIKEDIRQMGVFLRRFRGLIIAIGILGVGISLSESFGVALIIPLLEGIGQGEALSLPFPFNKISLYFSQMNLAQRIQAVALFMIVFMGLKNLLIYINGVTTSFLQQKTIKYYRMLCFEQLMRVRLGYFNLQRLGHIQAVIVKNTEYVGGLVCNFANIIPQLLIVILLLSMLCILSWQMTLISLMLVGISSFILRGVARKAEHAGKASEIAVQNINSTLFDVLTGMKIIRLFNRQKDMVYKFSSDAGRYKESLLSLNKINVLVPPLFEFIGITSLAVIMLIGSFVLRRYGDASLQVLLIFIFIFFRLMPSAKLLNTMRVTIAGFWPFLTRIHKFIQAKQDLYIKNGTKTFSGLKKSIEMRRVNFSYDLKDAVVLRDVSFSISKGAKVGIVGPSGGGKSTIVELLLRFYDPQDGQLLIDGIDLCQLDVNSWRRHIGVVTQDTFLFNDTVWENIAFAKPQATKEEIEKALKRAHAYDFVRELPQGYDTMLGERGVRLSGGQRQRIAIARAILAEPEILVFDEATSALDTEAEQIVQGALDEISRGKTVLTIAHRLSTISDADIIFVIAEGCIVQKGTHQDLVDKEGIYKRLVGLQTLANERK